MIQEQTETRVPEASAARPDADEPIAMRSATSANPDPVAAAAELIGELGTTAALYAVFVTATYPRDPLAAALNEAWGERLIGCTSAGNIGAEGFVDAPVVVIALSGGDLRVQTLVIEPISDLPAAIEQIRPELTRLRTPVPGHEAFALLLVDGLSMLEEYVASALKPLLGDTPLIGGSAGDDLSFAQTGVLSGGSFGADRATVSVVSTTAPFHIFRIQHHEPDDTVLVITAATPDERTVHEINGMPAAQAFADAIGVGVGELGPDHFSTYPVLLRVAGENWIRSIFRALPDGSLQFFAAIDTGAVLRLGFSSNSESLLRDRLDSVASELDGDLVGVLAFDCILRRMDFKKSGLEGAVSRTMSQYRTAGFSTYGEQFDDFHMNQTMVGVAFGGSGSPSAGERE
jgi:hypothetical protein